MPGPEDTSPTPRLAMGRDHAHEVAVHELRHDVAEARELVDRLGGELSAGAVTEGVVALLQRLEMATTRLHRSVDDLLDDPDDLRRLDLSPVRVAEVVERVVGSHDPRGHSVDPEVASLVVELDRVKFERIVDNLLLNALHHTPAGCRVRIRVSGRRGGGVRLVVEDDGPGLPPEEIDRLLDPESAGGGGLGIVSLLTQLHGGTVQADCAGPDGGLRVTVELPGGDPGRERSP